MSKIRAKDTKPEMIVRRLLHAEGYRYRLHRRDLPGRPDIVFGTRRKAILVHGCFWHQHPDSTCLDGRKPKSNTDYWNSKLARNIQRDQKNLADLVARGWEVLVIWECEVNAPDLLDRLTSFLD